MRVKNTFLELDLPPADLRRLETCPGKVEEVPKGTMLSAPKENAKEANWKKSWADMESDDEEPESGSLEKPPARPSWADMDSDDETPCKKGVDLDGFFVPATPPEPEAETSPRNSTEPVIDEWCTVQRKGKSKGSAVRKEVSPEPMPYKSAPVRQERRPAETRRAPERQAAPPRTVNGQVAKRVDVNMVDGPFPVVRRLIGPGGANLRKIKEACGAVLSLRGKGCPGSGPASEREGPLHILINARPQDLATAIQMTEDLIADVRSARARAGA